MEITEVRVKLVNGKNEKLRAFCSITLDNDFVVRDLKVIEGGRGPFVAMPSRKVTERCARCGGKNHYRARFCNDCGASLGDERAVPEDGSQKFHTDIAHPINSRCREVIQKRVLEVYEEERKKSGESGYRPMHFDVFDEASLVEETVGAMGEIEAADAAPALEGSPSGESSLPDAGPAGDAPRFSHGTGGERRRPETRRDGRDGGRGREGRRDRGRDGGRHSDGPRREGDRSGSRHGSRGRHGRRDGARDGARDGGRFGDRRAQGDRGGERTGDSRATPPPVPDRADELPRPSRIETSRVPPQTPPPAPKPVREEAAAEPEDNFGEGLFN